MTSKREAVAREMVGTPFEGRVRNNEWNTREQVREVPKGLGVGVLCLCGVFKEAYECCGSATCGNGYTEYIVALLAQRGANYW